MKLFQAQRKHGFSRITLLGATLYERDAVSCSDLVSQSFFCGLVTSSKGRAARHENPNIEQTYEADWEKCIRFLGVPVYRKLENSHGKSLSILGVSVWKKSWERILADGPLSSLPKDSQDVWLLHGHSGEIYLLLNHFLPTLMAHRPGWQPHIVTNRPYHVELIRMICPTISCALIKDDIQKRVPRPHYEIDGRKVTVLFTSAHFRMVEETLISDHPLHYFHAIAQHFGMKADSVLTNGVSVSDEIECEVIKKAAAISLNTENFVFLAPEAASSIELSDAFWLEIAQKFRSQGLDVFVNATKRIDLAQELGKT